MTPQGVLKILKAKPEGERLQRLKSEFAALVRLEHSGIAKAIDSNIDSAQAKAQEFYIVTEFIPGRTLKEHIEQNGPLELDQARHVLLNLLDAIEFCHGNEIVHRDIKPDNILLRNGDPSSPVLIDFGLAYDPELERQTTHTSQDLGNRFLRLPELSAYSSKQRDKRSDMAPRHFQWVAGTDLMGAVRPQTPHRSPRQAFGGNFG